MTVLRRFPGYIEAACLIGLAGFFVYLLTVGNYWMYLNPKFRGLSWGAAAVLGALGVYSAAKPPAGATWLRASLYACVIALCLVSELGVRHWLVSAGAESGALEPETQDAPLPARVTKGGVEYVRINAGELYDITGKNDAGKLGLNYAVRGFVRRSPETDARGEFVLYRVALWCCFADSTAVGFRVRPPKGEALPENGTWVVAYGSLTPAKDAQADGVTSIEGSAFASLNPDYRFDARRLEKEKAPGMGMMYEWHTEEPYAY